MTTPESRDELASALALGGVAVSLSCGTSVRDFGNVVAEQPDLVFVTLEQPFPRAIRAVEYLSVSLPGTAIVAILPSSSRPFVPARSSWWRVRFGKRSSQKSSARSTGQRGPFPDWHAAPDA